MKKAIEMDPYCDEAFFQLGLAFLEQNWKKKAKECFQTALHLNPKELRYKNALEMFLKNPMNSEAKPDIRLSPIVNDESMEILVKDELHLNFKRSEMSVRSRGEGVKNK